MKMHGKCLITMLGLIMLIMSIEGQIDRRFLFEKDHSTKMRSDSFENDNDDDRATPQRNNDGGLSGLFKKFLSTKSNREQEQSSNSFNKLNLLKSFLSKASDDRNANGKLNNLFQLLNYSAADNDNDSSSSSSKVNRLLGLFKNQDSTSSSSNKLGLAMKLLNLSQGKASLSSFNLNELQTLAKFAG